MSPTKFDHYSDTYQDLVDGAVGLSGEGSEYFAEYKASYVARILGEGFRGKILDFGCGVGLLAELLRKHVPDASIHGYDVSAESINKISPDLLDQGVFSSDLSRLEKDYDVVVISNVMHHVVPGDRQQLISEVAERLVCFGRLILFEHNPLNPLTQWAVRQCPFDDDAVLLHPSEAKKYLSGANLSVLRRDYVVFFPRMFSAFRRLEPALRWLPAGAQYAVIGEKNG